MQLGYGWQNINGNSNLLALSARGVAGNPKLHVATASFAASREMFKKLLSSLALLLAFSQKWLITDNELLITATLATSILVTAAIHS